MSDKNIDKDIEILKELAEDTIKYKMVETDAYMAGAITRVLSELEKYRGKIIHLSDEEYRKVIDNAQKDIKKDLETWKKIAEKLAEYGVNCAYGIPVKFKSKEELIEIVKEEVENETNKARHKNT